VTRTPAAQRLALVTHSRRLVTDSPRHRMLGVIPGCSRR
jgi:hypothetical protein